MDSIFLVAEARDRLHQIPTSNWQDGSSSPDTEICRRFHVAYSDLSSLLDRWDCVDFEHRRTAAEAVWLVVSWISLQIVVDRT